MNTDICRPGRQMDGLKDGYFPAVKAHFFFSVKHACPIVKVENLKLLNILTVMYICQLQKVKKQKKKQVTLFELSKLKELENTENKVKEGELKIAAFVAEHDLSFYLLEHLPKLHLYVQTQA